MGTGTLVTAIGCAGTVAGAGLALGPWGLVGVSVVVFLIGLGTDDKPAPRGDLASEAQQFLGDPGRRY